MVAADPYKLAFVFFIIHINRMFMAFKWVLLLRRAGSSVNAWQAVQAYYVGLFWGTFLPSSVGADIVRVSWLMRAAPDKALIAASVLVERALGALALSIVALGGLALCAVYLDPSLVRYLGAACLLLGVTLVAVLAIFSRTAHALTQRVLNRFLSSGFGKKFTNVTDAIMSFRRMRIVLASFLCLSIVEQAFPIASVFVTARALGVNVTLAHLAVAVPIVLFVSRMPISVNGFGVQEGAFAFVLSFAAVPIEQAIMVSVVDRVLVLLATLPGGWWTFFSSHARGAAQSTSDGRMR